MYSVYTVEIVNESGDEVEIAWKLNESKGTSLDFHGSSSAVSHIKQYDANSTNSALSRITKRSYTTIVHLPCILCQGLSSTIMPRSSYVFGDLAISIDLLRVREGN